MPIWLALMLSLSPIAEIRGAIPLLFNHPYAFPLILTCILLNMLIVPLLWLSLDTLHLSLFKLRSYRKFIRKTWQRINKKREALNKYGPLALLPFTAIPLPFTGAYTAALIAFLLKLNRFKSFTCISLGICIAALLVWLSCYGLIKLF